MPNHLLRQCLLLLTLCLATLLYQSNASARMHACSPRDGARQCMICNCFFESSTEPQTGKLAVNIVVIARTNSQLPDFRGKSICGIIWQQGQFSWTSDRASNSLSTTTESYKNCEKATDQALTYFRPVRNPTHYYAATGPNAVRAPTWTRRSHFSVAQKVGHHVFINDSRERILGRQSETLMNMLRRATR